MHKILNYTFFEFKKKSYCCVMYFSLGILISGKMIQTIWNKQHFWSGLLKLWIKAWPWLELYLTIKWEKIYTVVVKYVHQLQPQSMLIFCWPDSTSADKK